MKTIITRTPAQSNFSADSNLHPLLKRIYLNRNITQPQQLEKSLTALLPFAKLLNIQAAVELLYTHLNKRILVIGDFDTDGATSTALCVDCLQKFGATQVDFLVPDRFIFGYGLTPSIVIEAAKLKPDLIITVDNGISSHLGVEKANEFGIKTLITDHHLPAAELPNATVIINPNQPDDAFASKHLPGVGVIFYVMLALRHYLRSQQYFTQHNLTEPNMGDYLDLVALGIVADVVPLDHNNRILVHQGLQRIRAGKCRPGIKALVEVANRDCAHLTSTDLGFVVGPRLNAAGRLDDMSQGIACLLEDETIQARMIAAELDALNKERREIETGMKAQAETVLEQMALDEGDMPSALVVYREDFHQGVIGIVAGRLKEKYLKPVIAFAHQDDEIIKGSARSIPGVHIRDVLDEVNTRYPGVIEKFGGHAMAAGLSLPVAKLQEFEQAFVDIVRAHMAKLDGNHALLSDGDLSSRELCLPFAHLLRQAGPFGQGFESPLFDGEFALLDQRLVGQKHLKMVLKSDGANEVDAIAFNVDLKSWPNARVKRVHIAYRLDINVFRGQETVQLIVEQIEAR